MPVLRSAHLGGKRYEQIQRDAKVLGHEGAIKNGKQNLAVGEVAGEQDHRYVLWEGF